MSRDCGRQYAIVSVRDSGRDNVDLRLHDLNGETTDNGIKLNEFPRVAASLADTMRYQVEVSIPGYW